MHSFPNKGSATSQVNDSFQELSLCSHLHSAFQKARHLNEVRSPSALKVKQMGIAPDDASLRPS